MKAFSWMRVCAVCRKETLHVLRDPWSLGLGLGIPILMLLLFGYALTLDVDQVPLTVWDQSRTQLSRDLIDAFRGSRYFKLNEPVDDYSAMEQAIDTRRALLALVIPRDFARRVNSSADAPVQMIYDGSDSMTATIAMGYATMIIDDFSRNIVLRQVERQGKPLPATPLRLLPRIWFNEELQSRNFIVPGLIAISMMIITALLTSLTIAREWERGSMEQLIATPVKSHELILGKIIPYFAIGMFDMLIIVLMGDLLFHVPMRGSYLLLFAISALFLVGVLGLGILISILTRNQLLAGQLAIIATFLPAFLLSGFIYPIENMPRAIQIVTYAIPARYFIELLWGIYLKGVGLEALGDQALFLIIFAALMLLLANLKLKKRLM